MKSKYHKKYYKKNRLKILAQQAIYKLENSEKRKAYDKEYRKTNKDKIKARNAAWYKENIDKVREHNHKTRKQRLLWNAQWIKLKLAAPLHLPNGRKCVSNAITDVFAAVRKENSQRTM